MTGRDEHSVYLGATFNLAHSMKQMLYFRPHNKFEEFDNCYLVGGGTHPGSGLPTNYESGKISAGLIMKKRRYRDLIFHKFKNRKHNLENGNRMKITSKSGERWE